MFDNLFGKKKVSVSLEDQLNHIEKLGFSLNSGFSIEQLLEEFDRMEYEKDPYRMLLMAMGGEVEVEDETWVAISKDIWHFDTECIEDHGDYVRIAHRLRDLAEGYLPIVNVEDYVDIEEGEAWLSFELDGKANKWDLIVDDDWVDTTLFSRFAGLLSLKSKTKKLIMMSLEQDCMIAFADTDQLRKLNKLPGLEFDVIE